MRRLVFPLVNAVAVGMLLGLLGYYLNQIFTWVLAGAAAGLVIGLAAEFGLKPLSGRLYRRRVMLVTLIQIPLVVFFVAPYAYIIATTRPQSGLPCCITPPGFDATYRDVRIPAADGETLAGWFVPPTTQDGSVIMLLHGGGGNRLGTRWFAERLSGAGYGVLMYDQRALGESTGSTQSLGWLDQRDIPAIVDFLIAQPEVDAERIGGVGLSLGAHILIFAAPHEPRIAAFWLDGTSAGRIGDFPAPQNVSEQFAYIINGQMDRSMQIHLGITPPPPLRDAIPQIAPRPHLLISATLDPFEYRINQEFEPLLGENGELWVIEGAPHVGGPGLIPGEYTARLLAFFDDALGGAGA